MEIQEIERLAALLKPSGTIERGDAKTIEQRGAGVALRSQMQGNDIIKQSLELPEFSLALNPANNTIEILLRGAAPNAEERDEVLHNAAHFLRHIQNRDQLSQNLLRQIEAICSKRISCSALFIVITILLSYYLEKISERHTPISNIIFCENFILVNILAVVQHLPVPMATSNTNTSAN